MTTEPQRLGKYELQKRLGHGGMGEVWKAFDTQLQRYVAIKLLHPNWQDDPGFVDRFKREAQFIASLHHPHIMQIHDFYISEPPETASTFAYMVMDYIQGQTLADFIRETSRKGNFPAPEDIVYILTGVSLALDYAHQRGMIHRDIKPSNILLDQRPPLVNPLGKPVLIDFGIARLQGASMVTVAGALVGTPQYISPEQALGRQSNHASDLYALGIILYEMMTGVTPFRGDTTIAVLMQHVHELPPPPETINTAISPALSEIIIKSIAKVPADRFQSATEMTIAVARALSVPIPRSLLNNTAGTTSTGAPSSSAQPSQPSSVHAAMARPTPVGVEDVASTNPSQVEPVTPARGFSYTAPAALPHPAAPPMLTPAHPLAPAKQQASARTRLLMLLGVFLCIFALSSAGAWWHFTHMSSGQTAPAASGQVTFSHSSNYSQSGYDTVQIDMQGVPTPPAGKAYYAWIESGASEGFRPHWKLVVQNGSVHMSNLTSAGNHSLLQPDTILLITVENAGNDPLLPNTDLANRLYYAPLQQNASPPVFTIQSCPPINSSSICLR